MPPDPLQRRICNILAVAQKAEKGGYLAGGVALQEALKGSRLSKAIDRFHDSEAEVQSAHDRDTRLLVEAGLKVEIASRASTFIRARITDEEGAIAAVDWAMDSAFRFFPLEDSPEFGPVLSPFDLATNKTLAMVGRLEIRDWLDMMLCHDRLQPLGCLAFAACGKDPGFSPSLIVEMGARCTRYAPQELARIRFTSKPPGIAALHRKWHRMIDEARALLEILPPAEAGQAVLLDDAPFRGSVEECRVAREEGRLRFHAARLENVIAVPKPALIYPPDFDDSYQDPPK
jgi:hypothetical protein